MLYRNRTLQTKLQSKPLPKSKPNLKFLSEMVNILYTDVSKLLLEHLNYLIIKIFIKF